MRAHVVASFAATGWLLLTQCSLTTNLPDASGTGGTASGMAASTGGGTSSGTASGVGGTSAGTGTGEGGSGMGGMTSSSSSSGAGGELPCENGPGDSTCTKCTKLDCCEQREACADDANCTCWAQCYLDGNDPEDTCLTNCLACPNAFIELYACVTANCDSDCEDTPLSCQ